MLNQPIDRETSSFKQEWFKPFPFEKLENRQKRAFLTLDSKGTEAKFDGTDSIGVTLISSLPRIIGT